MASISLLPRIWREDFKIHSYEIGPTGHARPQAICRFIQEAASNHADRLNVSAEAMAAQEQMWVLSTLSLRLHSYPRWHETMRIETWPVTSSSSLRGLRDMTLFSIDPADGSERVIGQASTLWLLLDKQSRKPLKIPAWVKDVASPGHEPPILLPVKENSISGDLVSAHDFVVRGSDIDWNLHVNNVSYLEWALETLPAELRLQNQVSELDISFLAEGKYGQTVTAQCFQDDSSPLSFIQKIIDSESGDCLALVRNSWMPRQINLSV